MTDVGGWPERVLTATALAARRRCRGIPDAEVLERDGLVLSLTNVPEPSLNSAYVEREPVDPAGALAWAEDEMGRRGHDLGIDLPSGRWPALDRAIREAGLELLLSRPVMVAELGSLPEGPVPPGVRIRSVDGMDEALALARVDASAFGTRPEVSEAAFAPGLVGVEGARGFLAWEGGRALGSSVAQAGAGATGVFGVGVLPEARRRGIGAALTVTAARAFPADLAWLVPSDMARRMYERLGFRDLETWQVWVRRRP
ncbi:MAG TPA: GNAT family N-acetyltransferase [Candidatus Limnocylindrales bacterium]|nr:GNAT family N-acetyltransferase [Candidatus Limnocylindrales bacterium]